MADREFKGGGAAAAVSGTLSSGATTINLSSTPSGWPSGTGSDTFVVVIDRGLATEEKVLIESISGAVLTVASGGRGYDGTTAQSHSASAAVELCLDAVWLQEINEHYNDTALDHHTQYLTTGRHDVTARHTFGSAFATPSAPPAIGTSASAGAAAGPARSDHTHNIGSGAINSAGMFAAGVVDTAAIADVNVTTGKVADLAVTTGKINDLAVTTGKIAASAVTAAKIDTAVAGDGLAGGGGTALSVRVDNSTIEILSDILQIKDSGVTYAKLAAALQALLVPTGAIQAYGSATAPTGWLLCDGASYSTTTYAALYAIIGTTFGSGSGTFKVPDLRGRVPVGKDDLGGTAASRITNTYAGFVGTTMGAAGGDQRLHAHTHSLGDGVLTGAGFIDFGSGAKGITTTSGSTGLGGSQNVQPSIIVSYIIKT